MHVVGRSLRSALLVLAALTTSVVDAAAWGDAGHQVIGRVAQQLLDDDTRAAVARAAGLASLREDELARMGTWPDDIKRLLEPNPRVFDTPERLREAQTFVARFPDHPAWHYVNLPLGSAYPEGATAFTRGNDVVQSLLRCVAILEGRQVVAGLTKPIALRFLTHLVGDIHQPLHVGSGYFDLRDVAAPRLVPDPASVRGALPDHGGNKLFFGTTNLHATWDFGLVQALGTDVAALAAELRAAANHVGLAPATGDHLRWPREWASESSRVAAEAAHRPLRFGPGRLKGPDEIERIEIAAPGHDAYLRDPGVRAAARRQLMIAAIRLAELLRRIRWQ